ncbi:photosystem II repair protein PSB27-H1, chloroplastic [Silene latifolia]|uniref:photosystem II repair protein PSB27-H1, chloroplastic n=1 Tax=Silene latifolia TaxID=37657 RepID=UPI003D76C3D9
MASSTLITPTSKLTHPKIKPVTASSPASTCSTTTTTTTTTTVSLAEANLSRRHITIAALTAAILSPALFSPATPPAYAADEEYVKETEEVISKVRATISLDRNDPNVADAVAGLREASNSWVAKYRREKSLLGRVSFRDMYSALNAVSGHYVSFGPTAPIPAKRKARILEEMDTAEKALLRGR